jgi:hypothetical protein
MAVATVLIWWGPFYLAPQVSLAYRDLNATAPWYWEHASTWSDIMVLNEWPAIAFTVSMAVSSIVTVILQGCRSVAAMLLDAAYTVIAVFGVLYMAICYHAIYSIVVSIAARAIDVP